jgi:excinuclease ABC subunit A
VRGASLHNLKHLDLTFPAGGLVTVTGVSGSGKSSLVQGVLAASLRAGAPVGCRGLTVHLTVAEVLALEQAAAGPGGTSTVATLAGVAEPLRRRFAALPRARALGLKARHFGTAAPGGRCETCQGRGFLTVAMDLLPEVTVGCEDCQGQRFLPAVLECELEGRTLPQCLDATVAELAQAFAGQAAIAGPLRALADIGLGYLRLGQDGQDLSAGEWQRLRLAGLLGNLPAGDGGAVPPGNLPAGARCAVLLDEPTRGLGRADSDRLLAVLRRLAAAGHLVVAVAHDLHFIRASDWIIDLGPEAGDGGGGLVVQGTAAAVAGCRASHTGRALAMIHPDQGTPGPLPA